MKCLVSCVTYEPASNQELNRKIQHFWQRAGCRQKACSPKFLPTIQCHVGLYFLSNSFLMNAAMSFSTLYFSKACSESSQVITWLTLMWVPDLARPTFQYWTTTSGAAKSCTAIASWSELGSASLQKAIPVLHSQWRPAAYPRTCQHS